MKPYQRVANKYIASQKIEFVETDDFANTDSTHGIAIVKYKSNDEVGFVEGRFGLHTLEELSDYACSEDILALYELWEYDVGWRDEIPVFEVLESNLDKEYRSKKLVLQMYKELAD